MMNKSINFPSYAISASAGCGKTEEMALRLLGMCLSDKDNVQQIFQNTMAATFSRSGAKEIYSRIVELLFDCLLKDDIAGLNQKLHGLDMGLAEFDRQTFMTLLRELIFAVNELKICTIDSFMNSIVNSFFIELGLPSKPEIVNSAEINLLHEQAMKKMLLKYSNDPGEREKEYRDLANECKKALYGKDSRNYYSHIQNLIGNYNKNLDTCPELQAYNPNIVAKNYFSVSQRQSAWDLLKDNQTKPRMAVTADRASLYAVLKKIVSAEKNTPFSTKELNRMRDFFNKWVELKNYQTNNIKSFTREPFTHDEINAIIYLLSYGAYILLHQIAIRSDAMLNLTRRYRQCYDEVFYQHGKLTFDDLPRLLSNTDNDWTYDIAYRLNSSMCNYLIDEFQDTSRIQWHVLSSLFDRSDENTPFSLFIVGDVKQAIYGWRSGDRRLMGEVIKSMNLDEKGLNCSFRYGKNICSALNYIFDGKAVEVDHFFPNVGKMWAEIFKTHSAYKKLNYRSKFDAFLLQPQRGQNVPEIFASLILKQIKEGKFIENNDSCAIIVRDANTGSKLLEYLNKDEEYGKYFIWEGKQKIGNDKLIKNLMNLLIYIQHPADTMAKELANMLHAVRFLIPETPAKLTEENNRLQHEGFYSYLKNCIASILKKENLKLSFSERESIELFLQSAYEFDQSSLPRDSRIFKDYICNIEHSNEAVGYKIPLMTMHKSKGLTFGHVFCAVTSGISVINKDTSIPLCGSTPSHNWILNSINEEFTIYKDINDAWNETSSEDIFEEICNIYVALTRAKYTMTLLMPPLADKKWTALNSGKDLSGCGSYFITDYITSRLFNGDFPVDTVTLPDSGIFSHMEFDDCDQSMPIASRKNISKASVAPVNFKMLKSAELKRRRIRPSDGIEETDTAQTNKLYFSLPDDKKGKSFGSDLHNILCRMDDLNESSIPLNISAEMRDEIMKLCSNQEISKLLEHYDECWKERSFDVVLQQNYISGCFDRVQLYFDENHKVKSAVIIDYKSGSHSANDIDKIKRYHRQLNTYRSALSQLLQLPITEISCFIIWTSDASLEEVNP